MYESDRQDGRRCDLMLPSRRLRIPCVACVIGASLLVGVFIFSCASNGFRASSPQRSAEHARFGLGLRVLMGQLDRLTFGDAEATAKPAPSSQVKELAALAEALARSAGAITDEPIRGELDAAEKREFVRYAESLNRAALELNRAAEAGELMQLPKLWDQVIAACNRCHSRFRGLPEIDWGGSRFARRSDGVIQGADDWRPVLAQAVRPSGRVVR